MRSYISLYVGIALLFYTSAGAAQPREDATKATTSTTAALKELRGEVRAAIKASDRVTKQNRDEAVRRLIDVHQRVKQVPIPGDERDTLERRVEARLAHLADLIQRRLTREAAVPNARLPAERAVLAQQGLPRPAVAQNAAAFGFGPNRAGVALQPADNGQDLVELIQRTIAPSSWDVNGGPGTIVYFSPLRALVVRNRSDIHEQLGDVIGQMRR